jgi:hypothetical protein
MFFSPPPSSRCFPQQLKHCGTIGLVGPNAGPSCCLVGPPFLGQMFSILRRSHNIEVNIDWMSRHSLIQDLRHRSWDTTTNLEIYDVSLVTFQTIVINLTYLYRYVDFHHRTQVGPEGIKLGVTSTMIEASIVTVWNKKSSQVDFKSMTNHLP